MMMIPTKRIWLVPFLLILTVATGCEEALFTANTEETLPAIPEGSGTPWVEFTGDEEVAVAPDDTTTLSITLGTAIGEPVTVEYETSGDAVAGTDYDILSGASPVTIPFDTTDSNLDEATIEIRVLPGATAGRMLEVTLSGAASESGQSLDLGRGGTEIDQSRAVTVSQ